MNIATQERIEEIAKRAAKKKEEILNSPSEYPKDKKTFYVDSIDGNDENDGLSEKTAWRTIDKLNTNEVEKDSVVLFRRGGLWRGTVYVKEGVY